MFSSQVPKCKSKKSALLIKKKTMRAIRVRVLEKIMWKLHRSLILIMNQKLLTRVNSKPTSTAKMRIRFKESLPIH